LRPGSPREASLHPWRRAPPLGPEFAKIPGSLIQGFYGAEEEAPGCLDLKDKQTDIVRAPGAHHFGHDYDAIAEDILQGLRRRAAPSPPGDKGPG
jgi:type IV secretory pathway VirJ component